MVVSSPAPHTLGVVICTYHLSPRVVETGVTDSRSDSALLKALTTCDMFLVLFFKIGFLFVTLAVLELTEICQPLPSEGWN